MVIFISNCAQHWNQAASAVIKPFVHHAVVVFFVLSGYVIAFSTLSRSARTLREYAVARLSRLYSVVAPALLLTIALQVVGNALAPEAYAKASRGADAMRYALAAVFMQSAWTMSASPPTNGPLWSLSYEAWYYVGFGAVVFARSRRAQLAAVAVVAAIAGPNILLLAPAWLAGVALYLGRHHLAKWRIHPAITLLAGAMSLLGASTCLAGLPYPLGQPRLFFSASFLSDWLFTLGIALVIASVDTFNTPIPTRLITALRKAGDYTFPVYLFHFPILFFVTALTGFQAQTWAQGIAPAASVLCVVLILAWCTEQQRSWWRKLAEKLLP